MPSTLRPGPVPHLAPGVRVVRRGRHHLQVGLYAGQRVLLPRNEVVQRTLTGLLERRPDLEDPAAGPVLDRLAQHGCLAWESPVDAAGRSRARPPTVQVLGCLDLPGLPDPARLLHEAGAVTSSATWPSSSGPDTSPDVVLVLGAGETDRDVLDPLVRAGTSHLVVRLVDGGALLGPFVVPGVTACLRCIDAHRTISDPDHVEVTTRYVRATRLPRADGVRDVDAPTAAVALAWAVRDVAAHLRGEEPSTWSRTLHLTSLPARREEETWLRHPGCGCSWEERPGSHGGRPAAPRTTTAQLS